VYGLPRDFDASGLPGQSLVQICFGVGQIQLRFDKDLTIAVTSAFLYKDSPVSDARTINIPDLPAVQSSLLQLLHHTIAKAHGNEEGTLTLEFDNGHVLQCLDQPYYEAYQIIQGEDQIIV
jgi:hypothetical protein